MIRVLFVFLLLAMPAGAQTLRLAVSDPVIALNPNYAGAPIAVFGTIEECDCNDAGYDVAVSVSGPPRSRVVNLAGRSAAGVIATEDRAFYDRLPTTYFLLSNAPLDSILPPGVLSDDLLSPLSQIYAARSEAGAAPDRFDRALLAELEQREEFGSDSSGVYFVGPRFFTARLRMPSSALAGPYIVNVSLFRDGEIVATAEQPFVIRTVGFEAKLIDLVRNSPAQYGLLCIFVALMTGWIGGVIFRR